MLTRIHAYYLGEDRVCVSYACDSAFLLIGAHDDNVCISLLKREMEIMKVKTISTLFIPEWSENFCGDGSNVYDLLNSLLPTHIILPKEKCEKLFATRIRSQVEQYCFNNKFVDIQYVSINETTNTGALNYSSNNLVVIIKSDVSNNIMAHRFEANGKWTSINLKNNTFHEKQLKSDVILLPTFSSDVLSDMLATIGKLNPNVTIRFASFSHEGLFRLILSGSFKNSYIVNSKDVVITRNNNDLAYCYYYDYNTNLVTNKNVYIP